MLLALLATNALFAKTYVCTAKDGEFAQDAAYLVKVEQGKEIFLQGSKVEYNRDPKYFEGLEVVIQSIKSNKSEIQVSGLLMNSIVQNLTLDLNKMTATNEVTSNDSFVVNLNCIEKRKIKIKKVGITF